MTALDAPANAPMSKDYAAWPHPRWQWPSFEAFAATPELADGIHSIALPQGNLDLLLHGRPLAQDRRQVLPVIFSGAVTNRHAKRPPFFSGLGLAARLKMPVVSIADPSLSLDAALGLGWYSGSRQQPLQPVLTAVLAELARRSRQELLLVGGSGGGFAALYYAHMLGDHASALVWNPQTDWLEYEEATVRRYLAAAFPEARLPDESGLAFRKAAAAHLTEIGVVHALPPLVSGTQRPRRLVYLQNASDWHVLRHAAPFMDAAALVDAGDGFFQSNDRDGLMWFGNWGLGHAAPPDAMIDHALNHLLDWNASAIDLRRSLVPELSRYVDADHAPRDLREMANNVELRVRALSTGSTMKAEARLGDLQQGQNGVTYAFYVFSGNERIATRWYEPEPSYVHSEAAGRPATRVTAFARDGFGHQLAIKQVNVKPGRRIQIYGSCVSRDAFELMDHSLVLAGYIARSSFASAFDPNRPPARVINASSNIKSPFQRRMVERDTRRLAGDLLRSSDCDAILVDLIEERFDLLEVEGALVTISHEFERSGYDVDPKCTIESGSSRHMAAWKAGIDAFLAVANMCPVVVNRVYWASQDSEGGLLPNQDRIAHSNAVLAAMYQYLAEKPRVVFIEYPERLLVADTRHRWGVSPFHYVGEMYEHTMVELERLLDGQAGQQRHSAGS